MYALLMGLIGGVVCYFGATVIKHKLGYDDSLDAFGVHGIGGTLGAILTGVFAVAAVNGKAGLVDGNPNQVVNQLIATVITYAIAGVGSLVLLKIVDAVIGLRVTANDEEEGLDITQHGESGYNLDEEFGGTVLDNEGAPVMQRAAAARPSGPERLAARLTAHG
jgi:Amt family ammonium transporter